MSHRSITTAICLILAAVSVTGTGCIAVSGPGLGLLSIPIPVSPYHQKQREDRWEIEGMKGSPSSGPSPGGPAVALILRAITK